MHDRLSVSCIVRTRNEERHIGTLLDVLRSQREYGDKLEIVVVDSGSTDRTLELVDRPDVRLLQVPPVTFHYSRTLNQGIEMSSGELLVILSAHTIPQHDNWVQMMVSHFTDLSVAGVYCRQAPWPDAHWRERMRIEETFPATTCRFREKNSQLRFSNAASCIRRSVWLEHPFVLPAAEDREWADWALQQGYEVVYDAQAVAFHSHDENNRCTAQRLAELHHAAAIRTGTAMSWREVARTTVGGLIHEIAVGLQPRCAPGNRIRIVRDAFALGYWYPREVARKHATAREAEPYRPSGSEWPNQRPANSPESGLANFD